MSDKEISPEARQIVAAAFAFAGPAGTNEMAWRSRLNEGVLRAAVALTGRPAQMAEDMLGAFIFSGIYNGYELEESSTRLKVKINSEGGREKNKDADGNEIIRTDRTDGPLGKMTQRRLDDIGIGTKILVWKVMEAMSKGEDGEKARVLRWFEFIAPPAEQSTRGQTPPRQAQSKPAESPSLSAGNDHTKTVQHRLEALDNKQKAQVAQRCRASFLSNFMAPTDTEIDAVLVIISEVEKT